MANKPNPTPFIDKDTAYDAYEESYKWYRPYFEPLQEFERLARNRPSDRIDPTLPRVTDGTLSAIVQEQPKRIIQQLATGLIKCNDYPQYAKIADIVHRLDMLPSYNRGGDALQKHWMMLGKAMTYGVATSYTFFTNTNGKLHTDFVIPYAKDVLGEKGKPFVGDSNVRFLRSWYQKRDLRAIIAREEWLEKNQKGYKSDWDLPTLRQFMENGASAKPADLQTPAEREKGDGYAGGFEVIHCFQKGIGAEFYSFAPRMEAQHRMLRTKINGDPRGAIPLDDLYCNIDGSNPMGRGVVELSGGVQNVIDQQMQMFQFLTTLMMGPPAMVRGSVNKATVKLRPNAIIDLGANANNQLDWMKIDNQFLSNYASNYGLLKSQILNLNSSQDHSISAEAGNPAQSKTQAGVQASEARLGVSDNYLRKQFESWYGRQSETAINIQFSEMTADDTIKIEGQDISDIMESEAAEYYNPKTKELTIPYKKIGKTTFKFHADASSSEVKEDAENADKLTEVLKLIQTSTNPTILAKEPQIIKAIIDEIGAEGTDNLFPELDEKAKNGEGAPMAPAGPDPQMIMQMVQEAVQQSIDQIKQANETPISELLLKKFEKLPADVQKAVIAQGLGIETQEATPTEIDQSIKQQQIEQGHDKNALEIAKTAHQHALDTHNAAQASAQSLQDNAMKVEDQKFQQEQGRAQTKIAEKSAQMKSQQSGTKKPAAKQSKSSSTSVDNGSPQPPAPDPLTAEPTPQEMQVIQALLQRGFDENDAEQAIVMLRRGVPLEQITQALGAKYAQR